MPVQSQSLNTSAIAYLPFEFIEVLPPDASLLDAPLFFGALHGAALNKKLEEYKRLSSNIKLINAHDALLILKASSSSSHILFMLRCSPCLGNAIFVKLTKFLNPTLATLLMLSCLMSNGYRLVCLRRLLILWRPGKRGLGIRRAFFWLCQHILASAISTNSLQDFILIRSVAPADKYYTLYRSNWSSAYNQSFPLDAAACKQRAWDEPIVKDDINHLFATSYQKINLYFLR